MSAAFFHLSQKRHDTFAEKKKYMRLEKAMAALDIEKQEGSAKLNGGKGSPQDFAD